jgi:hypothetical protein
MPLYTFLHNLLNVLVQIANKMELQKNNQCCQFVCHVPSSASLCEILHNFSGKSDMRNSQPCKVNTNKQPIRGRVALPPLKSNDQHLYKCVVFPGSVMAAAVSETYRGNFCRNSRPSPQRPFFDVIQNTRRYFRTQYTLHSDLQ